MRFVDRTGTECVKYSKKIIKETCGNENALPFWVADMDFASPEEIEKALAKQIDLGVYGYHTVDVKDAFSYWCKKRHNFEPNMNLAVPSFGILNSIAIMVDCLEGDIIVPSPTYRPFRTICQNHNRKFLDWELKYNRQDLSFSLDFNLLEKIVSEPGKKIMMFCSPHNPSGLIFTEKDLVKVAEICKAHEIVVLCDEIHCDLIYPGENHIPFDVIAGKVGVDCVTFMAPSKTFNIAGEHFSMTLFSNEELKKKFEFRREQLFLENPSLLSTIASKAGYEHGYDWIIELTETLKHNADFIDSWLKQNCPEIKFIKPQASFIGFMDCSEVRKKLPEDEPLVEFFGKKAGILVNGGPWFGDQYADFVRFNFASDIQHIENALVKMSSAVKNI